MILDKFLNLEGTSIQGYVHLENIGIVFRIESKNKKATARLSSPNVLSSLWVRER